MTGSATGFWSYVHRDNEQDQFRIQRLAGRIADEFSMLTGNDLELFLDRDSIEWGEKWRFRIESALQETTFFIPLITPRYFASVECRKELMQFAMRAREYRASDLLLPILYVDVPDLDESSHDEAKALIAATQYSDWRTLRLSDELSEEYSRAVNVLATRLADIARDYESRPSVAPASPVSVTTADLADEPGLLDLIAELEPRLPEWAEAIEGFAPLMQELTEIAAPYAQRFQDVAGDNFAKRIVIAREFAAALDDTARKLRLQGELYSSKLIEIDPGVRATIALADEQNDPDDIRDAVKMFEQLRNFFDASRENEQVLTSVIESMRGPARMFKDVRRPLAEIEVGLRNVIDGQTIIDAWEQLIDASPLSGA